MPIIIDVREPTEFETSHVTGAINIPPSELIAGTKQLENIATDTQLIVYCVSGSRSTAAIPYLHELGFTNIVNGINQHHVEKTTPKLGHG